MIFAEHLSSIEGKMISSLDLKRAITGADFSRAAATVVGYGNMGKQYVRALQALGISSIRVCGRSSDSLKELQGIAGMAVSSSGFERLNCHPVPDELGIVSTPSDLLMAAARQLISLGFRKLLIEKPVSLWSREIEEFDLELKNQGVEAFCAYNRVAYPSLLELRIRALQERGMTSCTYTFTEMIKLDWLTRFPPNELARWGIANSMHVVIMAHSLMGWPKIWSGYRTGALSWHPTGAIFVGSGLSEHNVPFSYHADWGSTGRWSVEVHTAVSSYQMRPLEKLFQRKSAMVDWEEIPVAAFTPEVKAGFVEQVAAVLSPEIRSAIPLVSLQRVAQLTRYAEELFGYPSKKEGR